MNDEKNTNEELEIRPDELESGEDLSTSDDVEFVETDAMGDELKDKAKLKSLRAELSKSQSESRDNLTALQRSRADYVNLKRELDEVRTTTKQKTIESVVEDFLPIVDSFDMAMANKAVWESVDKNWRIGIEYIYSQFQSTLAGFGIEPIDKVGAEFDPGFHEPIEVKETEDANNDHKIASIIQKGYKIGDKVIRPARVIVWKFGK
jgi:molecular chaperone GrpE